MLPIAKAESNPNFPILEDEINKFWKVNQIFEKTLINTKSAPKYSFIDGPPFVTGLPHYGHLLCSIAKDVIPRYWTMKGYNVRRVLGWDCHGLPIEEKVSKQLGLKTRDDIVNYGIDKYINECRKYVSSCSDDWGFYIDKIGRWVDAKNAYYTMNPNFNESVLWFFKEVYNKNLIYKGKRVSWFSTDTSTPVSDFEVNMDADNYREVVDTAIYVKLPLLKPLNGQENVNLLVWTTTPWTIPAHCAVALSSEIEYSLIAFENQKYLCATNRLCEVFGAEETQIHSNADAVVQILEVISGKDLLGLEYNPPFRFFPELINEKHFKIYEGDFVTNTDGTGFVHLATYGKEDFELFQKTGIVPFEVIDQLGVMQVGDTFKGQYLREACDNILAELQTLGALMRSEEYPHKLPFYRGNNPLIQFPQDSYFINIQSLKPQMQELNQEINWYPKHLKNGRFADVIAKAPDWCISRNRFWATIMPIWEAKNGDKIVIGSIAEMAEYNSQIKLNAENVWEFQGKLLWLHRDVCDKIVLTKNDVEYHRVPEVLDCWMDSGAVPFAEHHYPFENQEAFESAYPADYIVEYVGQIRAWFNIILRMGVLGFNKAPFKNAVVTGNIAGNDGRKMSKSFGNYPDSKEVLNNIGAEALRLYLMGNNVMSGEDTTWSDSALIEVRKDVLIPFWNVYSYFTIYSELHNWTPVNSDYGSDNILDKWVLNIVNKAIFEYSDALENYNIPGSVKIIQPVIDNISTWWIRRSRDRFAKGSGDAMQTLYHILIKLIKTFAPQMPFITENIYQNLVVGVLGNAKESVHLEPYPTNLEFDQKLIDDMQVVRELCSIGLNIRTEIKINLRQPLQTLYTNFSNPELLNILQAELNTKSVVIQPEKSSLSDNLLFKEFGEYYVALDPELSLELKNEGIIITLCRHIQNARKVSGLKQGVLTPASLYVTNPELIDLINLNLVHICNTVALVKLEIINQGVDSLEDSNNKNIFKIEGEKLRVIFSD